MYNSSPLLRASRHRTLRGGCEHGGGGRDWRYFYFLVSVIPVVPVIARHEAIQCFNYFRHSEERRIQILFHVLFMIEKYQKLPRWTKTPQEYFQSPLRFERGARSLRSSMYCSHLTQTVCPPPSPHFLLSSYLPPEPPIDC